MNSQLSGAAKNVTFIGFSISTICIKGARSSVENSAASIIAISTIAGRSSLSPMTSSVSRSLTVKVSFSNRNGIKVDAFFRSGPSHFGWRTTREAMNAIKQSISSTRRAVPISSPSSKHPRSSSYFGAKRDSTWLSISSMAPS